MPTARLPATDLDHVLAEIGEMWENVRGNSVFLTGGTGFVGTWLLESLLWADDKLKLGVNAVVLTRSPERFRVRAPHLASHPSVRLLGGSIDRVEYPDGVFPFVVHAATEPC